MIDDTAATLVWLAPDPPRAEQVRSMAGWARAHHVTLTAPSDERPAPMAVDLAVAQPIEDLLDRARDGLAARDADGVERAMARAESLLRAHPELPQAAWLMAEVERARSTRWRKVAPQDSEAADRAWARAESLDGGRVAAISEERGVPHPPEAVVTFALPVGEQAWLDGAALRTAGGDESVGIVLSTRAGPHALVVTAGGAPIWASWLELGPGRSHLDVAPPPPPPCSTWDVARATRGEGSAVDSVRAKTVRCAAWVAAAPGPAPDTLRVARCAAGRCESFVEWREWLDEPARGRGPAGLSAERVTTDGGTARKAIWPQWATWALAGTAGALVTGIAVVASGALRPAPTATRFVTGGLKQQ